MGRRAGLTVALAVIVLASAAMFIGPLVFAGRGASNSEKPWDYGRLQSEVEAGNVASVEVRGQSGTATDVRGGRHQFQVPGDPDVLVRYLNSSRVPFAIYGSASPWARVLPSLMVLVIVPLLVVVVLVVLIVHMADSERV
jgi:hypothetical protein